MKLYLCALLFISATLQGMEAPDSNNGLRQRKISNVTFDDNGEVDSVIDIKNTSGKLPITHTEHTPPMHVLPSSHRTAYKYIVLAILATGAGIYSDASQISASIIKDGIEPAQLAAGVASWLSRFILFGIVIRLICLTHR